jgi:crotonobetainyl-CoA hydratase
VKAIVDATGELPVPEGYARLRDGSIAALARVEGSADAAEGPRAFAAGRDPVWRGE